MMDREEVIQLLITLKMQSRYSSNGTFVDDIKPSSFVFVINSAIEALKDESYWKESYEAELNKTNRQLEDTVSSYEGCFHYCPYCGKELKGVVRDE